MNKKLSLMNNNIIIQSNKKAYYNFFIHETFKAGLVLRGCEVRNFRLKKVNIESSYIIIRENQVFLYGLHLEKITTVSNCNDTMNDVNICKLLLKKKEILFLKSKVLKKGYTIVPLSIFLHNSWFKLNIGVAIGKKMKDKRQCKIDKNWLINKNRILKNVRNER
ncbi:MAG: SsrA-binding protein SmpB [Buchnera aphidicola (Eriosoma harunire)]